MLVTWIGKATLYVTKLRGGGSALPGLIVEKIAPNYLQSCAGNFDMTLLVAGTNGKTTTTKMIRAILEAEGKTVVNNAAGSNMPRGIISAILERMDWHGNMDADIGLFEIDEGFIGQTAHVLEPESIVVLNLLRDQLDRYGELDRTTQLITDALPHTKTAVLNGDDPRVAGMEGHAGRTVFFGAEEDIRRQVPHDDALHRKQPTESQSEERNRTVTIVSAETDQEIQRVSMDVGGATWTTDLQVPGVFNAYNAATATALTYMLGIAEETVTDALNRVTPAFGRGERISIAGKDVVLLLVKNPAGFNQIINTHLVDDAETPALIAINDNYADGRDVSWLWDVNIERLSGSARAFIAGGIRGYDMALRLQYADISAETERDFQEAINALLERVPEGGEGHIVPTYTAMYQIRKLLMERAEARE